MFFFNHAASALSSSDLVAVTAVSKICQAENDAAACVSTEVSGSEAFAARSLKIFANSTAPALTQYNSANAMTLSNSNFANFRDVGMVVHPGNDLLVRT
ncbi:MAG: hypothetical protein ACKODG_10675, partial [Betaproteobacteria bacterium]